MADLAVEWGFQPFAATTDGYPGVSHGDGVGKRAQKTDKRRQRQLQEMVSGVVRLKPAGESGSFPLRRTVIFRWKCCV